MDTSSTKPHHLRTDLCKTRPAYRQGRKFTAVKTYTINSESQHLFIYGVPQINLRSELKSLCSKYGKVLNIHAVKDCDTEMFTECYHVQYDRIQSARIAKRLIDDRSFFGSILHVCYAPEYESVIETRGKLLQRCRDVLIRLPNYKFSTEFMYHTNDAEYSNNYRQRVSCYEGVPVQGTANDFEYGNDKSTSLEDIDEFSDNTNEEDPILIPNFRKRKYVDVMDHSSPSSSNVKPNHPKNNKSLVERKPLETETGYSGDAGKQEDREEDVHSIYKRINNLIPAQVIKNHSRIDKINKRIVFHNKNLL